MAGLQEQLDALNASIRSGERKVKTGEIEVEYRSLNEMIRARDDIERTMGSQPIKTTHAVFDPR